MWRVPDPTRTTTREYRDEGLAECADAPLMGLKVVTFTRVLRLSCNSGRRKRIDVTAFAARRIRCLVHARTTTTNSRHADLGSAHRYAHHGCCGDRAGSGWPRRSVVGYRSRAVRYRRRGPRDRRCAFGVGERRIAHRGRTNRHRLGEAPDRAAGRTGRLTDQSSPGTGDRRRQSPQPPTATSSRRATQPSCCCGATPLRGIL